MLHYSRYLPDQVTISGVRMAVGINQYTSPGIAAGKNSEFTTRNAVNAAMYAPVIR